MNKVKRKKILWLVLVNILVFSLLVGLTTNLIQKQMVWNHFKRTYSMEGIARLEDNIAIGVKMIRGEQALQVLQSLYPQSKKPAEGNEFLLVTLNIKNFARKQQNLDPLEFSLKTKDLPGQKDGSFDPIDIVLPDAGEYKRLDMFKPFEPGEVRNGSFVFEIPRESQVDRFFFLQPVFESIPIKEKIPLNYTLSLLSLMLFYGLYLIELILVSLQRKRRSDGKKEYFYLIVPVGIIFAYNFVYYLHDPLPLWFALPFVLLLLFMFILIIFKRRGVLVDLNFLSKKDRFKLIDKFEEKMGWVKTTKIEMRKSIEVFNPSNKDSYRFYSGGVYVKNPTIDSIKAKEVLLDLYCDTKFDRIGFLWTLLYINVLSIYLIASQFSHID